VVKARPDGSPLALDDPAFWEDLLKDLSEIGDVRAHFEESGAATDRWWLEGSPTDVDELADALDLIAVGLGLSAGPHAWVDVLETLRRESKYFRYGGTFTTFEYVGKSDEGRYGTIENLKKAAKSFCRQVRKEIKKSAQLKAFEARALDASSESAHGVPAGRDRLPPLDTEKQRRDAVDGKLARVRQDTDEPLPYDADSWKAAKEYQSRTTFEDWVKKGSAASPPAHQTFCRLLLLPSAEFVAARRLWRKKPKRGSQKKADTD